MTPSEAVVIRAQMVEGMAKAKYIPDTPWQTKAGGQMELKAIASADLFTWRQDLVSAALQASASLPSPVTLRPDLMPAPNGLFLLAQPIRVQPVESAVFAIGWGSVFDDYVGIWLYGETRGTNHTGLGPLTAHRSMIVKHGCELSVDDRSADWRRFKTDDSLRDVAQASVRFLVSAWLWLKQTVVRSQKESGNRASRKIASRIPVHSEVNVIQLRRVERNPSGHAESSVEYSCQWLVRGHWRQQWYPATTTHRPIWIEPHLKGPDDKPLKIPTENVFAVNR